MFEAIDRLNRRIDDLNSKGGADYYADAWTPTFTNLTAVGGPPIINGNYVMIGHLVYFYVHIDANGGTTASILGTTYVDNLPFTAIQSSSAHAFDNTMADLGNGLFPGGTTRLYVPTWGASANNIVIDGWMVI